MPLLDTGKLESVINLNFLDQSIDEEMSDCESNNIECDICRESFASQNEFLDHVTKSGHGLNNDSEFIGNMPLLDTGKLESVINPNFLDQSIDEDMSDC